MKLTLSDKVFESDLLPLMNVSIKEARAIREKTGLTIAGWQHSMQNLHQLDDRALTGLVLLLHLRAKQQVDWDTIEDMTLSALGPAFDFELTDTDRADIARASAADWAELETVQAENQQEEPVDLPKGKTPASPGGRRGAKTA